MTQKLPPTDNHEHPPTTESRGRRVKIATVEGTMDSVEVDYELHSAPSSSISLVSCLRGSIAEYKSIHLRVLHFQQRCCVNFYVGVGFSVSELSPSSGSLSCASSPDRPFSLKSYLMASVFLSVSPQHIHHHASFTNVFLFSSHYNLHTCPYHFKTFVPALS